MGVACDPGNFTLATMFLALRHALGMETEIDRDKLDDIGTGYNNRPAAWTDQVCPRHPVLSTSGTAGLARKPGQRQVITNLNQTDDRIAECLRLVLESLLHDEKSLQRPLNTAITNDACENMGDVLEAA